MRGFGLRDMPEVSQCLPCFSTLPLGPHHASKNLVTTVERLFLYSSSAAKGSTLANYLGLDIE